MGSDAHQGHLGAVYGAKGADEIAARYDSWAETYEAEMARAGYRHPSICLALIARYLPRGAAPLLDAGAGTGLVGEWLSITGYPEVEALDVSGGMLAVAAKKNVYRALHKLALGGPLPFADGYFAGVISAGVFTTGHVGPEGIDELVRATRHDGVLVLTVKTTLWDDDMRNHVARYEKEGTLGIAEITDPYVSMPGETGTVPSLAVVLRKLK